jgi:predicted glycosyltransferase
MVDCPTGPDGGSTQRPASVLIDVSHPAHAHFFRPIARTLLDAGVAVHIVARDKDVTVRLLEAARLPFEVLPNSQPSASRFRAAAELVRRTVSLRQLIRRTGASVVLSRNPSGVLAALGTRARSVFDTDDGRGVGVHYWLARPFADVISSSVHDSEQHGRGHRRYRALKAQMFLHPERFTPDVTVRRRYIGDDEPLFVVRFSAHDASHDRHIDGISEEGRAAVVALVRARGPARVSIEREGLRLYRGPNDEAVPIDPADFHDLLATASLFVGDSQSVAAEAAILGIPSLRLSGFTGRAFYLGLLEDRGMMLNFLPGDEARLLAELEMALDGLPERRQAASRAAERFNAESEDLLAWFHRLVLDLL